MMLENHKKESIDYHSNFFSAGELEILAIENTKYIKDIICVLKKFCLKLDLNLNYYENLFNVTCEITLNQYEILRLNNYEGRIKISLMDITKESASLRMFDYIKKHHIKNHKISNYSARPKYIDNLITFTRKCLSTSSLVFEFSENNGPAHCKIFTCTAIFDNFIEKGVGSSKKEAKQISAFLLLQNLESNYISSNFQSKFKPDVLNEDLKKVIVDALPV
jgi:hypothetical protein